MDVIPHRELRNNSSGVLARVANGESIAITNHGDVAAILIPPGDSVLNRVIASGKVRLPVARPTPFTDLARVDGPSTAAILDDLRGDR